MGWKVYFQYKPTGHKRPYDEMQDEELELQCELPNVGGTVAYMEGDKIVARKVLTRHFSVTHPNNLYVNIVVTDVDNEEMGARLKE